MVVVRQSKTNLDIDEIKFLPNSSRYLWIKAMLHCNFLSNLSCNAAVTQVAEELLGVTCYLCNLSRNISVARNVARSRTQFYFFQQLQQLPIAVAQCNTPPATCLTHNALLDQPIRILTNLSSVAVLRVACSPIAQCNTPVPATAMLRF